MGQLEVRTEGWEPAHHILQPKGFYGNLCFLHIKTRTSRNNHWKGEMLLLLPAWMLKMVWAGAEYIRRRETLDNVLVQAHPWTEKSLRHQE